MRDTALLRLSHLAGLCRHLSATTRHRSPPPGTDIYLVPMTAGLASMKTAKPSPVSAAPGYDNQPNFSPDGTRILFAGNRDGKQIDVYVFDRADRQVTQLTQTAENENSPTYRAGGRRCRRQLHRGPIGVRQVRRQAGQPDSAAVALQCRRQVAAIDPRRHQSGRLSRVDRRRSLVLFVLGAQGKPATLQIASVKTGQGRGRRRQHRPIAASHSRHARSPASCSARRRASSGSSRSTSADEEDRSAGQGRRGQQRSRHGVDAGRQDHPDVGGHEGVMSWTRGAVRAGPKCSTPRRTSSARSRGSAVSPKGDAVAIVVAEAEKIGVDAPAPQPAA